MGGAFPESEVLAPKDVLHMAWPKDNPNRHPPWKKGESGNPTGRAKSFARLIREETREGAELVEFALEVLRNKNKANIRMRFEAMYWLADRGWGRAVVKIDMEERLRQVAAEQGLDPEDVLAAAESLLSGNAAHS